ncbi:sorting nexin-30-like isoform X3 [Schistocerca piceifrons]|uniref:sorting nexin-30-like isoform X3 n=1 Tax=Schistocerca piceifrons TaxID=274613 RepID=UPI001F5F198C|nr:sorting nexin-30-like isoform X3 [Schistocerca piceifrons]
MSEIDDTAVLDVSSECKSLMLQRQCSRDTDVMSNYSTSLDDSVVASPSVESFSTLPDQELSEFGVDTRDLVVKVDNPQKHLDTLETYITFRITTKPLPAKHTLIAQLDRYSKEFIIARMALLHRFLNRIASHPVLSCNLSLKIFLTAKPSEFSIHRKCRLSLLGRVSNSLQNLASVYMMHQKNSEFDRIRDYLTSLGEKLTNIDKIAQRIQKERQEYLYEMHQMHPIFTLWSASEPELSPVLLALASAVEHNSRSLHNVLAAANPSFVQPLKEYLLYIQAVKEALQRRDAFEIEYELAVDELKKKRAEKEQLMAMEQQVPMNSGGNFSLGGGSLWRSSGEAREEKIQKLGVSIPQLIKQVEENQDKVECANEDLRADLERWNHEKKEDLKKIFLALANQQIKYYEQCLGAWEEVLPEIRGCSETSQHSKPLQVSS